MSFKKFSHQTKLFFLSLYNLAIYPQFLILTFAGNLIVFIAAYIFLVLEASSNELVNKYIDAVWWAFTTVTTVGFGDIVPITFWGRVLGIILMLIGTALFATYISLFAEVFLGTTFDPTYKATKHKKKFLIQINDGDE